MGDVSKLIQKLQPNNFEYPIPDESGRAKAMALFETRVSPPEEKNIGCLFRYVSGFRMAPNHFLLAMPFQSAECLGLLGFLFLRGRRFWQTSITQKLHRGTKEAAKAKPWRLLIWCVPKISRKSNFLD